MCNEKHRLKKKSKVNYFGTFLLLFDFARTKISIRAGDDCAIATGPKVEPYPERVDGEEPDAEAARTASHAIVFVDFQLLLFQVDGFPAETLP